MAIENPGKENHMANGRADQLAKFLKDF